MEQKQSGLGISSMILGIVAIVSSCLIIGGPLGIIGLTLGIIGTFSKNKKKGCAIAGIVCSSVAILLFTIILLFINFFDKPEEKELLNRETDIEDNVLAYEKEKYNVGETWTNKNLSVTYAECGDYQDYNNHNRPADGMKIVYLIFEFENIGSTDQYISYTDFEGYADGYEVNQSYVPEGTGIDFSVKLSSGRKGTGIVAFEIPDDANVIECEYSPNFWTSEKVVFIID